MNILELPNGNGQEIYIDIDELYIKREWINQELEAIVMPDIPSKYSNPVYEAYKEMFKYLYEKGYKIVTDDRIVNEDTFFFSPCLDKHINKTKEEYSTKKDNKIALLLMEEGITEPFTVSFPLDSFPENLPPLPFVLKNKDSQGGKEMFLIKTPKQLEILKRFYNEITPYAKKVAIEEAKEKWNLGDDVIFDEFGRSNTPISIGFIDYKKEFHDKMIIQKYIKTPTKYNTSLRVLTSSSGDVLASSLKYSAPIEPKEEKHYGLFDRYLQDPSSPYFLGSESIISNTVSGGDSILLGKDSYENIEQKILLAHDIDPNNAIVPETVMKSCINVATKCKREVGAICGMDFIYDEEERIWKYLEEHEYPMLYSYAEKYNLSYDSNKKDFYTTNQLLDMRVRLHALALTIQKKYTKESGKHI